MNIKKYLSRPLTIITLAVLAGIILFGEHYIQIHKSANKSDPLAYASLISPLDRKPLPLPEKGGRTLKLPILMYHHIGECPPNAGATRKGLTVSTVDFEQQTKWLSENGFASVSLKDVYLYSRGQISMPPKPIIFTFDDGYADALENAIPILQKFHFTGSFGIITQYPGQLQGTNLYASWQQIAQAKDQGMEIVSHTQNHFDGKNPKFPADYIFQNLSGSVADIKNNLGINTNILIYPYGHYTDTYIEQAKKTGFVMGVTVHEGKVINLDDLMRVPRLRVRGAETLQQFKELIEK